MVYCEVEKIFWIVIWIDLDIAVRGNFLKPLLVLVGTEGFEPSTTSTPC